MKEKYISGSTWVAKLLPSHHRRAKKPDKALSEDPRERKKASHTILMRFINWRERKMSNRFFLLVLSLIIGILTSLVAFLLKGMIEVLQKWVTTAASSRNWLYLVLPPTGVLITALFVKKILKQDISHGVSKVLMAFSQRKSLIKPHNVWSSMVASTITIGLGGSVGAESPIVLTGSAIGSNLGRLFKLEQRNLMLLVGCGAAGAIAGIFKAPIAGLVFVIEVLLMDLTLTSVLPLLTASVTSAALAYIYTGAEPFFQFAQTNDFITGRIPYTLVLGVLCGFMGVYFMRMSFFLEKRFKQKTPYAKRFIIAAVVLSLLIFLFPTLYGEGYATLELLMAGKSSELLNGTIFSGLSSHSYVLFLYLSLAALLKVVASVATNSGGGCGGLFAPTLFVGGLVGFVFSFAINSWLPFAIYLPEENFVLMGMAGLMSSVMHAPLTGVFLIAELTGGYNLFLPLMVVSLSAHAVNRIFMTNSIYSQRLAEEGKLLTHEKDKSVLTLMNVESLIETDFLTVTPNMSLGDVVVLIGNGRRNIFPVIDDEGKLKGLVLLDDIRNIMFRPELYERFSVQRFMVSAPAQIVLPQSMESTMDLFDRTKAWNLPVVDKEGHYMGMLSKSKIFNSYRDTLAELTTGD